ncbi:hypothetical protein ACH347_18895 [Saccharopolyspora sp. 5N102]|uniref:hypothetical protein n=1 Tax=Saccharopolyspora sp. 5N102 TaxID=3375155 RepID=UPI00378A06A6
MPAAEVNGNTEAMSAFSSRLTAPPMPPSLTRLGTPPNLSGLFEGIAMSVLDKAATAAMATYLTKVTEDLVTDSAKVKAAAATYSAADVTSALTLTASALKLANKGLGLLKQAGGTFGRQPAAKPGDEPGTASPTSAA